jgi:hypothetical protein
MLCLYAMIVQKLYMVNGDAVLNFNCLSQNNEMFPLAFIPNVTPMEALPDEIHT